MAFYPVISLDDGETPKTNGQDNHNSDDERAKKRRRVSESTPSTTRPKPESPPWKKALADGPSSFTQDGKRKSGRVNRIPLELQAPSNKRQTRGAVQKPIQLRTNITRLQIANLPSFLDRPKMLVLQHLEDPSHPENLKQAV